MTQPTCSTIILNILPNAPNLLKVERERNERTLFFFFFLVKKRTLFYWCLPDKKHHGSSKEQDTETNPEQENSFSWGIFPLQE